MQQKHIVHTIADLMLATILFVPFLIMAIVLFLIDPHPFTNTRMGRYWSEK